MIDESSLTSLKTSIAGWNNLMVVIRESANTDKLASGLSLYLGLGKLGKKVSIASDSNLTVSRTNLFGVGDIANSFSAPKGGNMILILEDVVIDQGPDAGKVPALEKLDWYPEGRDLRLKFQVLPGQRFEPKDIRTEYEGGGYDAIISVGAANLGELGSIYNSNPSNFQNIPIVNIDNQSQNQKFGQINVVDNEASSVSEIVAIVLEALGVPNDSDMANNILTGIYSGSNNLTKGIGAQTFLTIGKAMAAGGKLPIAQPRSGQNQPNIRQSVPQSAPNVPVQSQGGASFSQPTKSEQPVASIAPTPPNPSLNNPFLQGATGGFNPVFSPTFADQTEQSQPVQTQQILQSDSGQAPVAEPTQVSQPTQQAGGFDLGAFKNEQTQSVPQAQQSSDQPQQETATQGEATLSEAAQTEPEDFNPAPDWLTPKVYKGGGVG